MNKYERIIANGSTPIARWLRGTINIFRNLIPTGRIVIFPDKDFEIKTLRGSFKPSNDVGDEELQTLNNNANAPKPNYENIVLNNWLPGRFKKNSTMDPKIMKSVKIVLEQKIQRQKSDEHELYRRTTDQKLIQDIINLKIQNNHLQRDVATIKRHLNI